MQTQAGILVPQRPERVVAKCPEDASEKQKLFSLLLNVTEACNIRCGYCVYGGTYPGKRQHNNTRMSVDTAFQAIDYLAAHSAQAEHPFRMLGWYGGEPLTNFKVIKASARYFRKTFTGLPSQFHLTSNGLLWDEEILDFFAEYEVDLVVSLDGPKPIHNRNRVGPKGEGTFDRVMANLDRLRARHPGYFTQKVTLNAVATAPLDLVELDQFFMQFPVQVSISSVEPNDFSGDGPEPIEAKGWSQMREKFIGACLERAFDTPEFKARGYNFVYYLFIRDMQRLHQRNPMPGFEAELPAYGNCVPGAERLFVNARGGFETCEKTDGSAVMTLGTIATGVSEAGAASIYDQFNAMKNDACRSCFNVRQCTMCFAHAQHGDGFSARKRAWNCAGLRRRSKEMLSLYCEILELDPQALDFTTKKMT
ncbi:radical SAM protein [Hoeflea sp.]|uniref:radical SAM protein n=1 Tax=Hoeflea sp. TaxID=1940281 RepID=UPI001994152C|nr:radical SAM protein [Hoeflea sp.]MBC7281238.1 radical SAM protein [Hoeflea sp.]